MLDLRMDNEKTPHLVLHHSSNVMHCTTAAPLPCDSFKCPPLSKEAMMRYHTMGRQSADALVAKAKLVGGAYDWKLHKDAAELKIYKHCSFSAFQGRSTRYCGVMEVVGDLDEYLDVFRYDSTDQARECYRRFGSACVDVAVLHTIFQSNPYRPNDSTRITWCLLKSRLDGLVARRDFVVLETDYEFQLNGRRAWVRSCRSIELSAFPDMQKQLRCRRGYMHDMGQVVVESDRPGYLHMTHVADMDMKGMAPSWAMDFTIKSWLRSMTSVDRFMRENRLSRTPFLNYTELCPPEDRSTCSLCRRKFCLLRKKSNCFKCGDVVCRACNRLWNLKVDDYAFQLRACLPCSLNNSAEPSSWPANSHYGTITTLAWPELLTKITAWTLRDIEQDTEVSIDLSDYVDSGRERPVDPIVLDIPSMQGGLEALSTWKLKSKC
ncbi:hypothetical protein LEN26_019302 [Aphanomyces euteiches]|nr:hypothetical protein LEN26_019302 [Aphanomyces euteiches]KAH9109277.1 hypothetical protein AeMF1_015635 [Aphanomyces euteiches]